MTHQHSAVTELVPLTGPVAAAACAASLVVALVHVRRMGGLLRVDPAGRPRGRDMVMEGSVEAGHAIVAVGMAAMFVAPARIVASWPFLAVYLGIATGLLVVLVGHPRCGAPGMWSCCALLVVEAAAMACMAGAGVAGWPLRADGAIGGWCVVVFGGACLVAAGGPMFRRFAGTPVAPRIDPAQAPVSPVRHAAARIAQLFPAPVAPLGSRLVMPGGMVLMLLART